MTNGSIFCDKHYEKRESAVRKIIGKQLNQMRNDFEQLDSPVMARLMNAQLNKPLTIDEILSFEPDKRQALLSAILYNDALWRLEAACIMLSIGMINVCYSNLRSCVDNIVGAHIIENLDDEAKNFLKKGEINPLKIEQYIPEQYNDLLKNIKKATGKWGVHCSLDSAFIGLPFGPDTFDKMISKTTTDKPIAINENFDKAAKVCIDIMGKTFIMFMWLMSKGTEYRRK
jgi:hypothetical protein